MTPAEAYSVEYWPLEIYKLSLAPPERSLNRRVALVTGGASGIGREIARRLASEGAHVVVADINVTGAKDVAGEIVKANGKGRAIGCTMDVTKENDVAAAFAEAVAEFGGLDIVVSNAGISSANPIEQTTVEQWDKQMDILGKGYFLVAREAFRVMARQGIGGSIIFIASKNALASGKNAAAYSSVKAAELHLARCLAEEGGDEKNPSEHDLPRRRAPGIVDMERCLAAENGRRRTGSGPISSRNSTESGPYSAKVSRRRTLPRRHSFLP